MATKTITITEDAYERLVNLNDKNESFSDVIVKHFPKHSLLEIAGILTHKEADELRAHISAKRNLSRQKVDTIAKALT